MRVLLLVVAVAKELRRDEKTGLRLGHEWQLQVDGRSVDGQREIRSLAERTDEARLSAQRGQRLAGPCGVQIAALPERAYTGTPEGEWGVVPDGANWKIAPLEPGMDPVVRGYFTESRQEGWSHARVSFKPSSGSSFLEGGAAADARLTDEQKMFAAGYLEGAITAHHIADFFQNTALSERDRTAMNEVFWSQLETMADKAGDPKPWHHHSVCAACQLDGLAKGYNARRERSASLLETDQALPLLSTADIMRLNADGQIDELQQLLQFGELQGARRELDKVDGGLAEVRPSSMLEVSPDAKVPDLVHPKPGRCSALVKLNKQKGKLFFGHTTFEDYKEQVRYWKMYDFPINGGKAAHLSFSSYPGCISSTDDFIISDQQLVATETTTNTRKAEALPHFKTEAHIPDYVEMLNAMRTSATAEELVDHFVHKGKGNTGTYKSQWMIGDYKKFHDRQALLQGGEGQLAPGTVFVVETGPGVDPAGDGSSLIEVQKLRVGKRFDEAKVYETPYGSAVVLDASKTISETGYWSSYNEPVLDPITKIMGASDDMRKYVFDDYAPKADDIQGVMALMRHNDRRDLVNGMPVDYGQAIAARGDLSGGSNFGGTDTKVVDESLIQNMEVAAIAGPTAVVDGECRPFEWDSLEGIRGIQKRMFYDWYKMSPKGSAKFADGCFNAKTPMGATPEKALLQTA